MVMVVTMGFFMCGNLQNEMRDTKMEDNHEDQTHDTEVLNSLNYRGGDVSRVTCICRLGY